MTKAKRLADNKRRDAAANRELKRREKRLYNYLNSAKVKKLRKDVDDAIAALNVIIDEWNDIILEDNPHFKVQSRAY